MSKEIDDLKEAIEAKGKAFDALKKSTDEYHAEAKAHGTALAETKEALSKINKDYDDANEAKEVAEKRLSDLEVAFKRRGESGENHVSEALAEHKSAFVKYCQGKLTAEGMEAAQEKALIGVEGMKALARNFQPGQGYLVPIDTSGRMVTAIHDSSNMRQLASVQMISTDSLGGSRDLGVADAEWTGEMSTPPEGTVPNVGNYKIPVHEIACKPKASQQLIEDSAINVEAWMTAKGSQKFGLKEETAFFGGDGIAKPRGIATYTPLYTVVADVIADGSIRAVKTGVNGQITDAATLVKMSEALKSGYQVSSQWGMGRAIREQVRLLKQDDKFVWQAGLQAGVPDRLLGYIVNEQNDLAVGTGTVGLLFGDFAQTYQIVDRVGFSLLVDPYSSKPLVEFYMRRRVGGDVINFDSMVYGVLEA